MIHRKPLVIRSLLYSLLLIHIFSYRVYAEIPTTAPQVILLFGTSCAGKSTIGRELQRNLGSCWQILDWDDYANEFGDDNATEFLLSAIIQELVNGRCLIVDTQPCVEFKDALAYYNVVSVLAYASLNTLIARDEVRQFFLKRPEKRRLYARAYIYETFFQLYGCDPNNDPIDEMVSYHVEPNFLCYPLHDATSNFFLQIAQSSSPISIYTRKSFDLIIKTDQLDIRSAVSMIRSRFFFFPLILFFML